MSKIPKLKQTYNQQAAKAAKMATDIQKKLIRFGLLRLLLFIVWIVALIFLFQLHWLLGALAVVLGISGFMRSVPFYQKMEDEKRFYNRLEAFNKNELLYLDLKLSNFEGGASYVDVLHPYSNDLDVFGQHSLFQLLNRSNQKESQDILAKRLQEVPTRDEVKKRQHFVKELSADLTFLQTFMCLNQENEKKPSIAKHFNDWLTLPLLSDKYAWLPVVSFILPIVNILAIVAYFMDFISGTGLLMVCLPTFMLEGFFAKRINSEINYFSSICKVLSKHILQIAILEKQTYSSALGVQLLRQIQLDNTAASKIFKQALRIRDQFEVRYNFLMFPVLVLLFWEFHWLRKSAVWKKQYGEMLLNQLQVVYEMEVYCSLGIFAHNHPSFTFPQFTEKDSITAEALGNPLLPADVCVTNDIELPTRSHIKLLTGSNMAGKSTFLRSIGCNIVLAYMGAPVFATKLELPVLQLITSMRTVDSLMDSTSSFWAELKRLQQVLELVQSGKPVYFLLDEILKGTNSRDRHTGNRAFIVQLLEQGGAGIIATHDLELTDLEANTNGKVENICIEVSIRDGKMHFDRKLQKGYSKSFNATLLMRQIGIDIPEVS